MREAKNPIQPWSNQLVLHRNHKWMGRSIQPIKRLGWWWGSLPHPQPSNYGERKLFLHLFRRSRSLRQGWSEDSSQEGGTPFHWAKLEHVFCFDCCLTDYKDSILNANTFPNTCSKTRTLLHFSVLGILWNFPCQLVMVWILLPSVYLLSHLLNMDKSKVTALQRYCI